MQLWRSVPRLARRHRRCQYLRSTDGIRPFSITHNHRQDDAGSSDKPTSVPNTRRQKSAAAASEILSLNRSQDTRNNNNTFSIRRQDVGRPSSGQPKEIRRVAGGPVEVRRRPTSSANSSSGQPQGNAIRVRGTGGDPPAGLRGKPRPKSRPIIDADADVDGEEIGYTRGAGGKRGPAKRRRKLASMSGYDDDEDVAFDDEFDDEDDGDQVNEEGEEDDEDNEDEEEDGEDRELDDDDMYSWSTIHEDDLFEQAPDTDFASEDERQHYMHLVAIQRTAAETLASADVTREEAAETGDELMVKAADEHDKATDMVARYAINELDRTPDVVAPRHPPGEVEYMESWKGKIGGVPTGPGGMGHVVEDALRYIANREDPEWKAPGKLAKRLIDGDFVKFDHMMERSEVLNVAGHLRPKEEPNPLGRKVGMPSRYAFKRLTKWQREMLVRRIVEGRYEDNRDAELTNPVLRNVARIVGGNPTFRPNKEDKVLDIVKSLLPREKTAGSQQQQRVQK